MASFRIKIERIHDDLFEATVPDLPQCRASGGSEKEARIKVFAAIRAHLDQLKKGKS